MTKNNNNEKLAYLVGLTVGDGHVERSANSRRIVIFSSHEIFIRKIRQMLKELNYNASCFYDKAANEWKLATRSKELYELLVNKYRVPVGNKTVANMDLNIPSHLISFFLAGLYDAEGWWDLDKGKYFRIRIKMNNESVIDFVFDALKSLGFHPKRHKIKNSFVVDINKQEEVKKFFQRMKLVHSRWLSIRYKLAGNGRGSESSGLHARNNGRDNGIRLRKEKLNL